MGEEGEAMKEEKNRWTKNILRMVETGEIENCPFCNSSNTNFSLKLIDKKNRMGFGVIWCNDCKSACHLSRIKIQKYIIDGDIPDGLIFRNH